RGLESPENPGVQRRARVVDDAVGVTGNLEEEDGPFHRPISFVPPEAVRPGRPLPEPRPSERGDRTGTEPLPQMRPVIAVLVPRRELAEPDDFEVELLPLRRAEVNSSAVLERLLASLHGVTARGHRWVAELHREAWTRKALPARRLRV